MTGVQTCALPIYEPATGGVPAPLSAARAASGICAHPALRVICPPAPRRPATAVLPTTRLSRHPGAVERIRTKIRFSAPALALPTVRRPHGPAGTAQPRSGPAPFSSCESETMRMIRSFSSRTHCVLRRDCESCAHPLKQALRKAQSLPLTRCPVPQIPPEYRSTRRLPLTPVVPVTIQNT